MTIHEIIEIIARALGPRMARSWDLLDPMTEARAIMAVDEGAP